MTHRRGPAGAGVVGSAVRGPAPHSDDTEAILAAYRAGYFPMARQDARGRPAPGARGIDFYTCDPRAVFPLEPGALRWSRSLRAAVRRGRFEITSDAAFAEVIGACASCRARADGDWINDWIIDRYTRLHEAGRAHSVEAWLAGPGGRRLVGGLYGVSIGGAFFGESMFSTPERGGTDASKVCLVHLVEHLRRRGFVLLDSQYANPHVLSLGAVEIPRADYLRRLAEAVTLERDWAWHGPWAGPPPPA
ncbi:MAG: leucyl/phenylalanyl-tRNA--protein transferase [Phycisphaerae bacterium]|nr:leucyl/phenylalanyl-tRNA--protein transferase [Phycisphaerae bacterium]